MQTFSKLTSDEMKHILDRLKLSPYKFDRQLGTRLELQLQRPLTLGENVEIIGEEPEDSDET